jgi:hypothetical protein
VWPRNRFAWTSLRADASHHERCGEAHGVGLLVITPDTVLAWRSAAKDVARPSFFLVGGLAKAPPPVAALAWIDSNRPGAILYSDALRRHAAFYWRDGDRRRPPKTATDCAEFRKSLEVDRPVLSTTPKLCGLDGTKLASFKRDARIHDKHDLISVFAFGR